MFLRPVSKYEPRWIPGSFFHPVLNNKTLLGPRGNSRQLRTTTDVAQMMKSVFDRIENIVGYQYFHLFPDCCPKPPLTGSFKSQDYVILILYFKAFLLFIISTVTIDNFFASILDYIV